MVWHQEGKREKVGTSIPRLLHWGVPAVTDGPNGEFFEGAQLAIDTLVTRKTADLGERAGELVGAGN